MSVARPLVLALAAGVLVAGARPAPLGAQLVEGRSYFFRLETPEDGATEGVMHVVGDRARIEIRDGENDEGERVYLLLTNGGRTLVTVKPDERTYSEMDAARLEGIIGTAMRAVDELVTMNMVNSNVNGERLGDGGSIAGVPTQRFRLTQEYAMDVGAFGQTERMRQRIVTDYWVNPRAGAPRNPLVELVTTAPTALAQSDEKFVERSARTRASLFSAPPLKVVVRASKWEHDGDTEEETFEYEITRILPASIDERALRVPQGYRRESEKGFDITW
jgi:hypothetical protein